MSACAWPTTHVTFAVLAACGQLLQLCDTHDLFRDYTPPLSGCDQDWEWAGVEPRGTGDSTSIRGCPQTHPYQPHIPQPFGQHPQWAQDPYSGCRRRGAEGTRGLGVPVRTAQVQVCKCVCLSVCYHIFCDYAQRDNKTAKPTCSRYTGFFFKKVILVYITIAFKSYGKQVNKPICKLAQVYLNTVRLLSAS